MLIALLPIGLFLLFLLSLQPVGISFHNTHLRILRLSRSLVFIFLCMVQGKQVAFEDRGMHMKEVEAFGALGLPFSRYSLYLLWIKAIKSR